MTDVSNAQSWNTTAEPGTLSNQALSVEPLLPIGKLIKFLTHRGNLFAKQANLFPQIAKILTVVGIAELCWLRKRWHKDAITQSLNNGCALTSHGSMLCGPCLESETLSSNELTFADRVNIHHHQLRRAPWKQ